nr:flavin reductase family protein [Kibdelosporangium sp. MJ126-NF4]CEL20572.1 Nitrilotriacetate monooxygenase component B [Kibdelosporangium sp. MJ126-NF4]CTQ89483.1 Nitrilotriacetate monooxygenase component B (EC 1.14.13.-) [Kibdelosporangium sp. MJ126-NF4]
MTNRSVVSPAVDAGQFKAALAHFPSGVTIVTAVDDAGIPHGLTASAFCSVSLDPPLICVCVARSARCHPVFLRHDQFAVNFLRPEHTDLAMTFAGKREDKFTGGPFRQTDQRTVVLDDALAVLECVVHSRHDGGDHTILVGEVRRAVLTAGEPLVFFNKAFHRVAELDR